MKARTDSWQPRKPSRSKDSFWSVVEDRLITIGGSKEVQGLLSVPSKEEEE